MPAMYRGEHGKKRQMNPDRPLPRHHLVWVDPRSWLQHLRVNLPAAELEIVDAWFRLGRPAIVRRAAEDPPPTQTVALGIPLSPARGRLRIALTLSTRAVRKATAPSLLTNVMASAPDSLRAPLQHLAENLWAENLTPRVYGSLLWEHLTRETYLTASSDIDLLLSVGDIARLRRGVQILQDWELATGLRADGEMVFPDGSAVAWRELAHGADKLLVKRPTSAELQPAAVVLRALATGTGC